MSTRCQVKVVQEGLGDWDEAITLYHHWDGYPSNMLPVIKKARMLVGTRHEDVNYKKSMQWEAGRTGKVASYLCAADPGGFEPEQGHELHGDIEWYYVIHAVNAANGSMAENPKWFVDVMAMTTGIKDEAPEELKKAFEDYKKKNDEFWKLPKKKRENVSYPQLPDGIFEWDKRVPYYTKKHLDVMKLTEKQIERITKEAEKAYR